LPSGLIIDSLTWGRNYVKLCASNYDVKTPLIEHCIEKERMGNLPKLAIGQHYDQPPASPTMAADSWR
jgi:hypothetical protein